MKRHETPKPATATIFDLALDMVGFHGWDDAELIAIEMLRIIRAERQEANIAGNPTPGIIDFMKEA